MAPFYLTLRQTIGSLKDQTSISIAKVVGSPPIDVALVKVTSHDDNPIPERYVQEIFCLTSISRSCVASCVSGLGRRLAKTHNWIVALKTVMLAHRLLREGHPAFEQELRMYGTRGMRVLNAMDFHDESSTNGWDYSAFVRTYGHYLDELLNCTIGSLAPRAKPNKKSAYTESSFERGESGYYGDEWRYGREYEDRSRQDESHDEEVQKINKAVKDMPAGELMENFHVLLNLLDRVLACRPTGAAKLNRLVQIALHPVITESFELYADIRDGLAILLDAFFDMEAQDCSNLLEMYRRAANQVDELITLYGYCKSLGVCKATDYPDVERISDELLDTMEEFLRKLSDSDRINKPKSPEVVAKLPSLIPGDEEEIAGYEINGMKALPAPPVEERPTKPVDLPKQDRIVEDLLHFEEPAMTPEEHGDSLALALFSGTESTGNTTGNQAAVQQNGVYGGASGWELALVTSESALSKPSGNVLAGGFDHLLLNGLYDQAVDRQKFTTVTVPAGSLSSVALPGHPQSSFLALPGAAQASAMQDPFAASVTVPPPPYVQMADMRQKQQHLLHEQQLWLQYQQDGVQGYTGLMKFSNNPFLNSVQPAAYTVPYYGSNSFNYR